MRTYDQRTKDIVVLWVINLLSRINFGNKSFSGFCRDSTENVDEQHDEKERHCQCQCCTKPTVEHSLGMLCVCVAEKKEDEQQQEAMVCVSTYIFYIAGNKINS